MKLLNTLYWLQHIYGDADTGIYIYTWINSGNDSAFHLVMVPELFPALPTRLDVFDGTLIKTSEFKIKIGRIQYNAHYRYGRKMADLISRLLSEDLVGLQNFHRELEHDIVKSRLYAETLCIGWHQPFFDQIRQAGVLAGSILNRYYQANQTLPNKDQPL